MSSLQELLHWPNPHRGHIALVAVIILQTKALVKNLLFCEFLSISVMQVKLCTEAALGPI